MTIAQDFDQSLGAVVSSCLIINHGSQPTRFACQPSWSETMPTTEANSGSHAQYTEQSAPQRTQCRGNAPATRRQILSPATCMGPDRAVPRSQPVHDRFPRYRDQTLRSHSRRAPIRQRLVAGLDRGTAFSMLPSARQICLIHLLAARRRRPNDVHGRSVAPYSRRSTTRRGGIIPVILGYPSGGFWCAAVREPRSTARRW
jgi:hypothetical protein